MNFAVRPWTTSCLFLVSILAIATVQAQSVATKSQAKVNVPSKSVLEAALWKSFGPAVEVATKFSPHSLTGDFNGDGQQDVLIIVQIKGRRSELPKDVAVINPFYAEGLSFPADPNNEPGLGIAILHGSREGWQDAPARKYLLFGESPVLILENSRESSTERNDRKDLMELVKKKGKHSSTAMRPPAIAKGDSVSLPTEAADSILYWDGKRYRWEESEGGE